MTRQVLICRPDRGDLAIVLKRLDGENFQWVYLGTNIPEFRMVESGLQDLGAHLDTTQQFHDAGSELRDPYLTYLYQIGQELNSLRWWITSLSYRSRIVSKTFHHICHLKVALDLINDPENRDSLVIVTSDLVLRSLEKNLRQGMVEKVQIFGLRRSTPFRWVGSYLKMLVHRVFFLARESYRIIQTNRVAPRIDIPADPVTLILSWATPENITLGGQFHESFFGNLASELDAQGHHVAVVPLILRETNYKQALQSLQNSKFPLIVPHQYISFLDLLRMTISSCKPPPRPRTFPLFSGIDITNLVTEELRGHWISNSSADMLLVVNLVRRWAALEFPISRFIYIFENQPSERALCWEVRRSFPQAALVGYQHAGMPHFLLNYYLAPGGEPSAPLPDRVVTVGKHTAKLLTANDCDSMEIRPGGALQVRHIFGQVSGAPKNGGKGSDHTVLVASSDGLEEASELAFMAADLFGEDEGIKVILKCHPRTPFEVIQESTGVRLPSHVEVSDQPIVKLMADTSLMVYSGSTVGVQAIALGLPCVHVRTAFDFDLDPLEDFPQARLEATGISELRSQVRWLLENRDQYAAEHRDDWKRIVEEMYGPVTKETYMAFVE